MWRWKAMTFKLFTAHKIKRNLKLILGRLVVYGLSIFHLIGVLIKPKRMNSISPNILIMGWYGTETTGDKGILAGIIKLLEEAYQTPNFCLSTYNIQFTKKTLKQLAVEDKVKLIDTGLINFFREVKKVDVVVVGGGPLMEDQEMLNWWIKLLIARLMRKRVILFGNGVGPIRTKLVGKIVNRIISLSNIKVIRDHESIKYLNKRNKLMVNILCDPAMFFVNPYNRVNNMVKDKKIIGINVRDWPKSYKGEMNGDHYVEKIVDLVSSIKIWDKIIMIPMDTRHASDDRVIFRTMKDRFINIYKYVENDIEIIEDEKSPLEVIDIMKKTDFFIGMRFHSNIFSLLSGVPSIGLDYDTKGGKVKGLYELLEMPERVVDLRNVQDENTKKEASKFLHIDMDFISRDRIVEQSREKYIKILREEI
jgi:polysaccharide pyruvyl transferase WcaK-like protein